VPVTVPGLRPPRAVRPRCEVEKLGATIVSCANLLGPNFLAAVRVYGECVLPQLRRRAVPTTVATPP
jgi:hypothetical protein